MNALQRLSVILGLTIASFTAIAQDAIQPYVEYRKRIESSQNVSPLDTGLFGEQVSLYNGSTTFSITDIDIPGNNALPVRLTRRFAVELQPQNNLGDYDALLRGVGNWDLDVPYMSGTYSASAGNALRCNGAYVPGEGIFRRSEVWQGISVSIPGRGSTLALGISATSIPRPTSGTYKLGTSQRDVFECIPMRAGFTGEGFRMTTSAGLRYYFDFGTTRTAARLVKHLKDSNGIQEPFYLDRNRLYLLASKIEDRFGNTVQFQYNANGHPTKIWSSDGREINLTYTGGRLTTATSHGRAWQYEYTNISSGQYARLSQVTQPDSSKWQYSYTDDLMPPPDLGLPPLPWCAGFPLMLDSVLTVTATHPSGAVGTFNFNNRRHYRSGVHATECQRTGDPFDPDYDLIVPHYFDVMSIDSKTLSGPGLTSTTWTYAYGAHMQTLWGTHVAPLPYPCTTCAESKIVTIINPDSTKSRYTFGIRYHDNDGRQLKVETLRADDTVIRAETNTYLAETEAVSQPFHGVYGSILGNYVSDPASVRVRPIIKRTVNQDGVDFNWQVNTCASMLCFDAFGNPTSVTKASTLPGSPSKVVATEYEHNTTHWVLGQVKKTTEGGIVASEATYNLMALPEVMKSFGKVKQTLTYNADGTVATVKDGNNNITTLSNWKRGIPQSIRYPATAESPSGATESAVVNDSGWITSVTDESGYKTCYAYDAMGRLSRITYPSETVTGVCDASAWNEEVFAFMPTTTQFGIPAGHWAQVHTRGGYRKITHFDALWRPIFVQEEGGAATVRYTSQAYDHEGRTTFSSYPVASASHITQLTKGVWTEYDALGRATSVSQDSELSPSLLTTLTTYAGDSAGPYTRVTDPRGTQTVTRYQMFDQPTYEFPVLVDMAQNRSERAAVDIIRDVFGKPLSIRKRNSANTVSLTRSYTYNTYQELCRSVEPETGATLMGYDGAGNVLWSAAGLPAGQACEAAGTSAPVAVRRTDRTYDARNRLKTLTFPDGRGNQSWTYTPDGLPAGITTYNETGNAYPVVNAYSYNRRRLLTFETSGQTGWYTWGLGYTYNAHGHLSAQSYPDGQSVSYAPNALGQPTQAGTYATGVSYYPNGAIKQFTYGNGIVHTMTQNARQLPARSTDAIGSSKPLDLGYAYDANGNVGSITDYLAGARQTRGMGYDGLDRLVQTTSSMFGTASYGYNVLDNLTSVKVSGGSLARDHTYVYDASNRLVNIKNTVGGATVVGLGYDLQGNLANKNGQTYSFTYGNRLRAAPGKETYLYDGHGRRVESRTTNYSVWQYSQSGQVMYSHDARNNRKTNYIYLGGSLVALREQPMSGGTTVTVRYQHTDALGTPIAVTDAAKAIVETSEYEPYGQLVNGTLKDGPGFTGHVQDAATGLTYMQQRYYDPTVGLFLSVDPVTVYSNPVGMFHRYRYANNNPYRFTDPDGRFACDGISTCRVATEERMVARGQMTQQQKQENDQARGAGAIVGSVIVAAVVSPNVRNGLVTAGLEASTQAGKQMTVDGKSINEVTIDKSDVAVAGVIGVFAPTTIATGKQALTNVGAIQTLRTQARNTAARAEKIAGRIEAHASSLRTAVGAWVASKFATATTQNAVNAAEEVEEER